MKKTLELAIIASILVCLLCPAVHARQKVLYIDSYHSGYAWSDGITRGIQDTLQGKNVELRIFRMDTKRNTEDAFKKQAALKAKALIESYRPDIVIASDDNASAYLIKPYFKDAKLPFIFCGINWSAEKYGYPYRNVTGMIEVAPLPKLLYSLKKFTSGIVRVGYLAADVTTARKQGYYYKKRFGVDLVERYVKDFAEWQREFVAIQNECQILIVGNNAGINDWDDHQAERTVMSSTRIPTGCIFPWLIPYSFLGYTLVAEEQGEWAAQTALKVLSGADVGAIPMTQNTKGDLTINQRVASVLQVRIPPSFTKRAIKVIR